MAGGADRLVEWRFPDLTVNSVLGNLPELLMGHLASGRRTAVIIEADDTLYVQAMVTERQQLVVECVSNRYLDGAQQLSLGQELELLCAGFSPPETDEEPHPNWWWVGEGREVMAACRLVELVLLRTFALSRGDLVVLIERPLRPRERPRQDAA